MNFLVKKAVWAFSLLAFMLMLAAPAKAQFWQKKETDPTAQYKVKNRSGGDYVYKSGGKRYNASKKKYDYAAGSWQKRKDNYRGSKAAFAKAKYNIKPPRTPRQPRERKRGRKASEAGEPVDSGPTTL